MNGGRGFCPPFGYLIGNNRKGVSIEFLNSYNTKKNGLFLKVRKLK